ncbi:MAG TPA: hypothetical protein VIH25_10565 [Steroidobacteraceae bacterium]
MRSSTAVWMLAVALLVSAGCTTDRLVHSWTEPSVKKLEFNRVVAVAMTTDGPLRRLAESEMVRIIGPTGVASSQVLKDGEMGDVEKVRARLASEGFDGAITIRLVDVNTQIRTARDPVPVAYYQVWSYYSHYWIADRPPDYWTAEQTLQVEVNIYSLKDGKLLWTGTSETARPRLVETLVKDVAELVSRRLKSERLI